MHSLGVAVLTISDTRNHQTDKSGQYLCTAASEAGHKVVDHQIVKDNIYQIRATLSAWIVRDDVQAIVTTGGTGFAGRDSTPEAVMPLFDKVVEGFGELFRHISYAEIGVSTIQSRALAGLANNRVIFCVPGSSGACKTAWEGIIAAQLNSEHRPCNFVPHLLSNIGQ